MEVQDFLTVIMFRPPLSLRAFWDYFKVERSPVRRCVLICSSHSDMILGGAHGLQLTAQCGAMVIKVFHLNGDRASDCFPSQVCAQ